MAVGAQADIQAEARALADPTRHSIFRYIVDAGEPVGVAELTDFVQLNHNAVRQHLAVLKDAGLIVEEVESRERPGRPRLLYSLHPEAAGSWGTSGAYAWLAGVLSGAVRDGLDSLEAGRQEGRRRAAEIRSDEDPGDVLEEEMVRRGFRPSRSDRRRRIDFVLERCPFEEVAIGDRETICQLHLGLAEGLTGGLGGLEVERLVTKNPSRGGCRLVVRRNEAAAAL